MRSIVDCACAAVGSIAEGGGSEVVAAREGIGAGGAGIAAEERAVAASARVGACVPGTAVLVGAALANAGATLGRRATTTFDALGAGTTGSFRRATATVSAWAPESASTDPASADVPRTDLAACATAEGAARADVSGSACATVGVMATGFGTAGAGSRSAADGGDGHVSLAVSADRDGADNPPASVNG